MVGTALTIEREMEDALNTRDVSVSGKSLPPGRGRGREPVVRKDLKVTAIRARDR